MSRLGKTPPLDIVQFVDTQRTAAAAAAASGGPCISHAAAKCQSDPSKTLSAYGARPGHSAPASVAAASRQTVHGRRPTTGPAAGRPLPKTSDLLAQRSAPTDRQTYVTRETASDRLMY